MDPPRDHEVPVVVLQPVVAVAHQELPGGLLYQEVEEGDGGQQPQSPGRQGEEEEEPALPGSVPLRHHQRERVQLLTTHHSALSVSNLISQRGRRRLRAQTGENKLG